MEPMQESTTDAGYASNASKPAAPLAGVIAVIGCDGSGKTSLTHDLLAILRRNGPAERRYLGTVSGEMGDQIKRLPMIGIKFERYLAAKARRAQDMRKRLPGASTAFVMYLFSLRRARHFREILDLSRRGVIVITDRFPQAEIPGFHYDGPGLSGARSDNWLVRKLAERELKIYEQMANHPPFLLIRLNVDLETALSRKPDHKPGELRDKIKVAPKLRFNGAHIVDVDASVPYSQVLAAAVDAVNKSLNLHLSAP
jgi:thymidylate kinase